MSAESLNIGEMRIVEVSSSLAGAFATRLAADLGADVLRVELDGGRKRSDWLDAGKSVIQATTKDLNGILEDAVRRADVIIWDNIYGRIGALPRAIRDLAPYSLELVGSNRSTAPWSEATLLAESGLAYLTGPPDGPPVPLPGSQVAMLMGAHGFAAVGGSIANGLAGRPAAHMKIAAVELLAGLHQFSLIDFVCNGRVRKRNGRRWANNHPIGCPTACSDGHVAVCPATDEMFTRLCLLLERPDLAEDARFLTTTLRYENADALDEVMEAYFARHTRQELFTNGNQLGAPVAPVFNPDEVLADESLRERGFWKDEHGIQVPDLGVRRLNSGARFPAPASSGKAPLEGIRVVEFTKVWAGPLAGRALADLGADVIRIESPWSRGPAAVPEGAAVKPSIYPGDDPGQRPWNRQGIHNILNRSRRSVCLDIKEPRAQQIAFDLCARADIILDNNRPGAMDRSGLGFEAVSTVNPGVIYLGMSGYGALHARYRDYGAYGPVTEAMGGLVWWIRDPARPEAPLPSGTGFPDPIIAALGVARVAAALCSRRASGRGEFIDLSQVECTATFLGDLTERWQQLPANERTWKLACDPLTTILAQGDAYLVATAATSEQIDVLRSTTEPFEPMVLRSQGIAAAWDRPAPGVFASPELADFWVELDHPDVGSFRYDGNPILASNLRLPVRTFPSLGADNRQALRDWLAMSDADCDALEKEGILCTVPHAPGGARG